MDKFEERPEDNWIKFIKARGKEEMEKISKADKAVAEAMEEWERLVDDPENHEEYLWREKELRDKISFIKVSKEDRTRRR